MPLNPADIIRERYRIIRLLGVGGFGETYLVEDLDCFQTQKVLKRLTEPNATQEAQELFQQEAELLLRLGTEHPQIPQIFAYFAEDDRFYLVQEYIQGHCLDEELTTPWSEEKVINFLEDLLCIVQDIHQQRVIHRDIKPSNLIRRDRDQKIVLIDFGAATVRRTDRAPTATRIIGTLGYAPAEQLMGYPQFNSDLYAVGIIAIQALTGSDPTQEKWELNHEDQFIWSQQVNLNPQLATIINKMTAYDFKKRYQLVEEGLTNLRELERKETVIDGDKQKKNKENNLLKISLGAGIILSFIWIVWQLFPKPCPVSESDFISCAGVIINDDHFSLAKEEGVKAYQEGNYTEALSKFKQARKEQPNDPESLIYLNNVELIVNQTPTYTIAVSLPLKDKNNGSDAGQEILRGVAQAQQYINNNNLIKDYGLQVIIADDDNKPSRAKTIAKKLGKVPKILGVIGNYPSDVTQASIPVYEQHQLVLISPTSTSEDLTNSSPFFFRTVSPDENKAKEIANYLIKNNIQKVAVFYNADSNFSQSFKKAFERSFQGRSIQLFDQLKNQNFNAYQAMEEVRKQGSQAIFLIPDGRVEDYSFNNGLDLIVANNNKLPLIGSDTLYSSFTLNRRKFAEGIVIAIPWHPLNSKDQEFPKRAEKEWKGSVSWRTAMGYDATLTLAQALAEHPSSNFLDSIMIKLNPKLKRIQLQKTLRHPNFKAQGVTGEISFSQGDRQENIVQLVTLIANPCSDRDYIFVPFEKARLLTCQK
ncbi:serine/threonine protein kinase [Gloeothece citriformis PCC 7424]|uniref:non-specific serine/threonine protein kinase n=2 Tax=Gloeothece TaxID=28070 RepID=B7KIJ1_GLOC7|nr:serine/threonine protein kinase [Gloeothece citriformis PCC 7424]